MHATPTRILAATTLLIGVGVVATTTPSGAFGTGTTTTFECGDLGEAFVVPDGVTTIDVVASGAAGGTGWNESLDEEESMPSPAGLGGTASGTLSVTPGETLQVNVGCVGFSQTEDDSVVSPGGEGGTPGGAGGPGGDGGSGGGGGGSSDVRQGGTGLDDRVVVAGGGGGSGGVGLAPDSVGGDGGGLEGEDGADGVNGDQVGAGGSGGGQSGDPARAASGGDGVDDDTVYGAGGGGGGGWFGGDGGAGAVRGGGGGGGSSHLAASVTDGSTSSGVQPGNGSVTLTYTPGAEAPTPPAPTPAPTTPAPAAAAVQARPTFTG